jgi:hypothetical protein
MQMLCFGGNNVFGRFYTIKRLLHGDSKFQECNNRIHSHVVLQTGTFNAVLRPLEPEILAS